METKDLAERLRAIRERAEKATPGPWLGDILFGAVGWREYQVADVDSNVLAKVSLGPDQVFILEAREDIPWLLDRLSEVESGSEGVTDAGSVLAKAIKRARSIDCWQYKGCDDPGAAANEYDVCAPCMVAWYLDLLGSRLASAAKAEARITEKQYEAAFDVLHRETRDELDGPRIPGVAAWTPSVCHMVLGDLLEAGTEEGGK